MAKLFKTSIFLLLAAFILIAEATHHDNSNDDDSDGDDVKGNMKKLGPKFRSVGAVNSGNAGGSNGGDDSGSGSEGCKCNDPKFKEFIKKFAIIYRAYISKELAPELKSAFGKLSDFTMNYLAKEKPNEVNKVHNFLQSSAKVTGSAVAQVSN